MSDKFMEKIERLFNNPYKTQNIEFSDVKLHLDRESVEILSDYLQLCGFPNNVDEFKTNPLSDHHPLIVNLSSGLEIEINISLPIFDDTTSVISLRYLKSQHTSGNEQFRELYKNLSEFASYYNAKRHKDELTLKIVKEQQPIPVYSRSTKIIP